MTVQMLAFLQHPYMLLAAKAMTFWTSLLSSSERAAGRAEPLTPENTPIPLDCVAALMDLSGIAFCFATEVHALYLQASYTEQMIPLPKAPASFAS